MIGTNLDGRYQLNSVIGKGGNGTIYRAHDTQMDREVAVKLMKSEGKDSPRLRKRFRTEALAAGRIRHPNVITIFDVAVPTGAAEVYMVMELLEGHDLHTEIYQEGPLDPARALKLFIPCLRALEKCHAQGVVHKDLKPSNLFLRERGESDESMCLLDFGVARLIEGEKITRVGGVAGTPRYMAPEYIRDAEVSPALDVYQIGLIFIEALTGVPCIPRGESEFNIFRRHLEGDLDMPDGFRDGTIGSILQRAVIADAEIRYANAGEFANALESIEPEAIKEAMAGAGHAPGFEQMADCTTQVNTKSPTTRLSDSEEQEAHAEIPKAGEVTGWFGAIRSDEMEEAARTAGVVRSLSELEGDEFADTELQLPLQTRVDSLQEMDLSDPSSVVEVDESSEEPVPPLNLKPAAHSQELPAVRSAEIPVAGSLVVPDEKKKEPLTKVNLALIAVTGVLVLFVVGSLIWLAVG